MPDSAVFSDEPEVTVHEGTIRGVTLTDEDPPLFEITLDPEPDVELVSNDTALLGVTPPVSQPAIIEVVPEGAEPVLDITLEPETVIDIAAVGVQGPTGPTGAPGETGPVGPQGPPGQSGIGASVNFEFVIPLSVWELPHNLGRKIVDVVTVDGNDDEMIGDVVYVDDNHARVEWYYPSTGRATVST